MGRQELTCGSMSAWAIRLDVSSPRGSFILQPGERPVVLLSAGIGATPVLAMLHALAAARSTRQVLWLHARSRRQHHAFAAEVRRLMLALPHGRSYVCYSSPASGDKVGEDFDATGRLSRSVFDEVGVPREADVYLCGPARFMAEMKDGARKLGRGAGADSRRAFQRRRVDDPWRRRRGDASSASSR